MAQFLIEAAFIIIVALLATAAMWVLVPWVALWAGVDLEASSLRVMVTVILALGSIYGVSDAINRWRDGSMTRPGAVFLGAVSVAWFVFNMRLWDGWPLRPEEDEAQESG